MIDMHSYGNSCTETNCNTNPDSLQDSTMISTDVKEMWINTLQAFRDNGLDITSETYWFELVNEPKPPLGQDFRNMQVTVDAIRSAGYINKIVIGGCQGGSNCGGRISNYNFYNPPTVSVDFADYTGSFVTDPQKNIAYTLHQYMDKDSSGQYCNNLINQADFNIAFPEEAFEFFNFQADYDIILGEFGLFNDCQPNSIRTLQNTLWTQLLEKLGNSSLALYVDDKRSQNMVLGTISFASAGIQNKFHLTTTPTTADFLFNTAFVS